MNQSIQNLIYLVIIVVTVAFFFWVAPIHDRAVHGILLPQSAAKPSLNASEVTVYTQEPQGAQLLGLVNTSKHFESLSTKANKANFKASMAYAKNLAAEYGANGLVYLNAYPGNSGPLDSFSTYWRAIYTQPNK